MKLYLSSQHTGLGSEYLLDMLGQNKRAAIIANAVDSMSTRDRKNRIKKEQERLLEIGIESDELDLRDYFNNPDGLRDKAAEYGMLWVRGGDVYLLRDAMLRSGFDMALLPMIRDDKLLYAGYSAGVIITAPDLTGSHLVDDPMSLIEQYGEGWNGEMSGLSIVDFYFATHYESTEPWAASVNKYVEFMQTQGHKVVTLRDGDVYIGPGGKMKHFILKDQKEYYV